MFAMSKELQGLVKRDPAATEDEKAQVIRILRGEDAADAVVTFAQAGRRLGVSTRTVQAMCKRGVFRRVKATGLIRSIGISRKSLDEYIGTRT